MPSVLPIGQSAQRDVERRLNLADSLQRSAVSTSPILSPLQGLAQLAQALSANQIRGRANEDDQQLAAERAKQLSEALNKTQEVITQGPDTQKTLQGIGGPEQLNIPGRLGTAQVPDIQGRRESLAAFSPEAATELALQEQLVAGGNTAGQIAAANRAPTALEQKLSLASELGIGRAAALKELGAKAVNFLPQGAENARSVMELGGEFFDKRSGEPISTPGQVIGTSVQAGSVSQLSKNDRTDNNKFFMEANSVFKGFERLEGIVNTGGLIDAPLASVRTGVISFVDQIQAGLKTINPDTRDERRLSRENVYDVRRIEAKAARGGFDPNKYSPDNIQENVSAVRRLAKLDARAKAVAYGLAYTAARLADPGGRLSEMDVLNQIRRLQLDSGSPDLIRAAMGEMRVEMAERVKFRAELIGDRQTIPSQLIETADSILAGQGPTSAPGNTEIESRLDAISRLNPSEQEAALSAFLETLPPEQANAVLDQLQ